MMSIKQDINFIRNFWKVNEFIIKLWAKLLERDRQIEDLNGTLQQQLLDADQKRENLEHLIFELEDEVEDKKKEIKQLKMSNQFLMTLLQTYKEKNETDKQDFTQSNNQEMTETKDAKIDVVRISGVKRKFDSEDDMNPSTKKQRI